MPILQSPDYTIRAVQDPGGMSSHYLLVNNTDQSTVATGTGIGSFTAYGFDLDGNYVGVPKTTTAPTTTTTATAPTTTTPTATAPTNTAPAPVTSPTPTTTTPTTSTTTPTAPAPSPQEQISAINAEANNTQQTDYSNISSTLGTTVTESDSTKIIKALISNLSANPPPAPPSLEQKFADERAALGVGDLETQSSTIDSQIAQLDTEWKTLTATEDNRLVASNIINRRKSKEQIAYEAQRSDLLNQKNLIVNQLNQKYGVINTIMQLAGQDYQNASAYYQTKFNQTIQLTQLLQGAEAQDKTDAQRAQENSRANLQIVMDSLKGRDYSTLSATTKTDITNMEIQSGLPVGFTEFVSKTTDKPIVSIGSEFTDANGVRSVPVYTQDPKTGVISTSIINLGGVTQATQTITTEDSTGKYVVTLDAKGNIVSKVKIAEPDPVSTSSSSTPSTAPIVLNPGDALVSPTGTTITSNPTATNQNTAGTTTSPTTTSTGYTQAEIDQLNANYDAMLKLGIQTTKTWPDSPTTTTSTSSTTSTTTSTTTLVTAKGTMGSATYVETILDQLGYSYDEVLKTVPDGMIGVIDNKTGQIGYINPKDYSSTKYTKL